MKRRDRTVPASQAESRRPAGARRRIAEVQRQRKAEAAERREKARRPRRRGRASARSDAPRMRPSPLDHSEQEPVESADHAIRLRAGAGRVRGRRYTAPRSGSSPRPRDPPEQEPVESADQADVGCGARRTASSVPVTYGGGPPASWRMLETLVGRPEDDLGRDDEARDAEGVHLGPGDRRPRASGCPATSATAGRPAARGRSRSRSAQLPGGPLGASGLVDEA